MRSIVAVPVKNEAERIEACLLTLSRQHADVPEGIVLVVNNTTDGTAAIVQELARSLPVSIEVIEHNFPAERASAGSARRMAMERAATLAGPDGAVLTTDADGQVTADWIAANLNYLRCSLGAVAGRTILDPTQEALIPARLRTDDALERAYAAILDQLASIVVPCEWDPWPRHTEHSGASIAVTVSAYHRVGGMPSAPVAEDRKFFAALEAVGARVRHAPEILVTVSGRIIGSAEGSMADTIRRRLHRSDPYLDDALEPAIDRWKRLRGELIGERRLVAATAAIAELEAAQRILSQLLLEHQTITLRSMYERSHT